MVYSLEFLAAARKQFLSLPKNVQRRVGRKIDELKANPRPPGVKAMQGQYQGCLRIRVGDYRVIYQVQDDQVLVIVIRVGKRGDVYR